MTRVSYSLVFWGVLNHRISFVYYFNDFFVFLHGRTFYIILGFYNLILSYVSINSFIYYVKK